MTALFSLQGKFDLELVETLEVASQDLAVIPSLNQPRELSSEMLDTDVRRAGNYIHNVLLISAVTEEHRVPDIGKDRELNLASPS